MRCRGAKSFVDDLVLSRGVVRSRAVHCCDLLRLSPLTRRFVRLRRTDLLLAAAAAACAGGSFVSACGRCWPVERTCDCSRCERVSMLVVGGGGCVRRARGVLSVLWMCWEAMPVSARSNYDGVKVAKRRACGFRRPVEWTC